ncbi:MAG: hypothetical protein ABFR75_06130 [Acidobacteriota bacterium]
MNEDVRGFSLFELLAALATISLIFAVGIPGISGFIKRIEIQSGVRAVTSSMNYSRYRSIELNRKIKYMVENNSIILKVRKNDQWKSHKVFKVNKNITININSFPVFFPTGRVAPLCSVFVRSDKYLYKITVSIAGRIKILKI